VVVGGCRFAGQALKFEVTKPRRKCLVSTWVVEESIVRRSYRLCIDLLFFFMRNMRNNLQVYLEKPAWKCCFPIRSPLPFGYIILL
jgi:hypothetical protein